MSPHEPVTPDTTFDGGMLEINADKIEARLNTVWQQATAGFKGDMPIAKLCLSNMIVVTDQTSRPEAETLTYELASGYPSRVILLVLSEDTAQYSAFVRTSCTRDRESGMIRCWEVIELQSDVSQLNRLPGALRSLLVGSVPVVSVDFRPFQTTPTFDTVLMDLADFYFVNADVVPSSGLQKTYLPFRWFRTLPIRELLGELMSRVNTLDCKVYPVRFETFSSDTYDTFSDLLSGWILYRLGAENSEQKESSISLISGKFTITIDQITWEDVAQTLRIAFSDGEIAHIRQVTDSAGRPIFVATYKDIIIERACSAVTLSHYIIGTLLDQSEFHEFAASNSALDKISRK